MTTPDKYSYWRLLNSRLGVEEKRKGKSRSMKFPLGILSKAHQSMTLEIEAAFKSHWQ